MYIEKRTVTKSDILYVFNNGPPPNVDRAATAKGIAEHKRIIDDVKRGDIPLVLKKVGVEKYIEGEKSVSTEIGPDHLFLSARVDMLFRQKVIELKPGLIKGRYFLEAIIGVIASGQEGDAIVYLYNQNEVYLLEGAGRKYWPEIMDIARDARIILDNQTRVDEIKKEPVCTHILNGRNSITFDMETSWVNSPYQERAKLGRESVTARTRFEQNISLVSRELGYKAKKIT